jgi:REP element-mobilizing transposase RayT
MKSGKQRHKCSSSVSLETEGLRDSSVTQECSLNVSGEKGHNQNGYAALNDNGTLVNFDFGNPLDIAERNLPHWSQPHTTYFVTFRLADSIPVERINRIKSDRKIWLMQYSEPYSDEDWLEYNKLFSYTIQNILDSGVGACILREKAISDIVKDALLYFDGKRYGLGEWVIMPNHVHVIVTPLHNFSIKEITHSWKSFTAHKINKLLNRNGILWQHESYDHIIRNSRQLRFISKYIIENPIKGNCIKTAQCSSSVSLETEQLRDDCATQKCRLNVSRENGHNRDGCATLDNAVKHKCSSSVSLETEQLRDDCVTQKCRLNVSRENGHNRDGCATLDNAVKHKCSSSVSLETEGLRDDCATQKCRLNVSRENGHNRDGCATLGVQ